jgi:hypothetical protein
MRVPLHLPRPAHAAIAVTAVLLGAGALPGCGDDSGGGQGEGGAGGGEKVRIALDQGRSTLTTRGDTVVVRGTVTPDSSVTLDAGQAKVDGDRFVATISGLNRGRTTIAIRAAKQGLEPATATVRIRRLGAARRREPGAPKAVRPPGADGAKSGMPEAPVPRGGRLPPPPPRVRPFSRGAEAEVRGYLRRYYRDTIWFRRLDALRIERTGIFVDTGLRKGNRVAERGAGEACFVLRRFSFPLPIRVRGLRDRVLAVC